MPMIATTIINSIRVTPLSALTTHFFVVHLRFPYNKKPRLSGVLNEVLWIMGSRLGLASSRGSRRKSYRCFSKTCFRFLP
jgi:hypothetical protein